MKKLISLLLCFTLIFTFQASFAENEQGFVLDFYDEDATINMISDKTVTNIGDQKAALEYKVTDNGEGTLSIRGSKYLQALFDFKGADASKKYYLKMEYYIDYVSAVPDGKYVLNINWNNYYNDEKGSNYNTVNEWTKDTLPENMKKQTVVTQIPSANRGDLKDTHLRVLFQTFDFAKIYIGYIGLFETKEEADSYNISGEIIVDSDGNMTEPAISNQWTLKPNTNGTYVITNAQSKQCLVSSSGLKFGNVRSAVNWKAENTDNGCIYLIDNANEEQALYFENGLCSFGGKSPVCVFEKTESGNFVKTETYEKGKNYVIAVKSENKYYALTAETDTETGKIKTEAINIKTFLPPKHEDLSITENSAFYEFANETNGRGDGKIIINSFDIDGICDLYWANEEGILKGLKPFASARLFKLRKKTVNLPNMLSVPEGADRFVGMSDGKKVLECKIPESKIFSQKLYGEKLYTFAQLSDVHQVKNQNRLVNALDYLYKNGCSFVTICGDITQQNTESELSLYAQTIGKYKDTMPVYTSTGNHDSSGGVRTDWEKYTGCPMYFALEKGDDVFLFLGMNEYDFDKPFTDEEMEWLENSLEKYRNKRVFLEDHLFLDNTVGNVYNIATGVGLYPYFNIMTANTKYEIKIRELLQKYKNVIMFNGHSHLRYYLQKYTPSLNITDMDGTYCTMVHCSSLTVPRDSDGISYAENTNESEGYIVDVYKHGVAIRAFDFIRNEYITEASYFVETTSKQDYISPVTFEKTENKASFAYTRGVRAENANIFCAFYDENGKLVSCFVNKEKGEVDIEKDADLTLSVIITEKNSLKPLCKKTVKNS